MKPEKPKFAKDCGPYWKHDHKHHWKHDDHPWKHAGGPPRHWIFMRVFFLFVIVALIFLFTFLTGDGFAHGRILHVLGMAFLILFITFFILGRLFKPMRMLMRGVHEISNGNLDFQFPSNGKGEFNYLAKSFNMMASNIKNMVQAKSQLLLDVSHELRSPLTRAKLAVEMMPQSKLKSSVIQDIVEMETMLTDILETENLKTDYGKLSLAPVNLTLLVTQLMPKYKNRKPGLKLMEKKPVVVTADEARVKTVLQNVFENALKYSSQQKKPVEITLEKTDEWVLVKVRDFGLGIPAEDQDKVFEPFYRVDKSRTKETGGYGLGLSLCLAIMKAHGGEIELESESELGTTIILKFQSIQNAI